MAVRWTTGVVLLFGVALSAIAEPPLARGAGQLNSKPLSEAVQDAIDLHGKGDFLKELENALKAASIGGRELDIALDALVAKASLGAAPNSFTPLLLKHATVKRAAWKDDKGWAYGSLRERNTMMRLIWSKATASKDPSVARTYSRGALVLAAHEDFLIGDTMLRSYGSDPTRLRQLAQLSDAQSMELTRLLDELGRYVTKCSDAAFLVAKAQEPLILGKADRLPWNDVKKCMEALEAHREVVTASDLPKAGHLFQLIIEGRELRNLVYSKGNNASKKAVDDMLGKWREDFRMAPEWVRSWVDESLEPVEAPLRRSSIIVVPKKAELGEQSPVRQAASLFRTPLGLTSLAVIGVLAAISTMSARRRPWRKKRAS